MDSDFELVRVAVLGSDADAYVLRSSLGQAGIPAYVASEQSAFTGLGNVMPTEVLVRSIDEENAKPVVEEFFHKSKTAPAKLAAWTCSCGAEIDEGFGTCWSCGLDYETVFEIPDESEDDLTRHRQNRTEILDEESEAG